MKNLGHVQIEKYFLKIENWKIKNIEMIQMIWYSLKTETNPSRERLSQITFELEK